MQFLPVDYIQHMSEITATNVSSGTKTVLFPVALEYTQSQSFDYDSAVATTTASIDAVVEGYANFATLFMHMGANRFAIDDQTLTDAIADDYDDPRGELTAYLDTLLQSQFAAAHLEDDDFVGDETPHILGDDTTDLLAQVLWEHMTEDVQENLHASLIACNAAITNPDGISGWDFSKDKIEFFEMILRISLETTLNPTAPAPGVTSTTDSAVSISVANGQQITVSTPVKTIKVRLINTREP